MKLNENQEELRDIGWPYLIFITVSQLLGSRVLIAPRANIDTIIIHKNYRLKNVFNFGSISRLNFLVFLILHLELEQLQLFLTLI